jgi:hypothetical protein
LPVPSPPYDDFPTPHTGPALAVGDFNRSGHAGLAVGLFQNLAAAILLGKGDGTFSFADTLVSINGQPTMSLTAADFNGDGDLDLVAANTLNGVSPVVLLGYGHGAFNAVSQNIEISAISSAAGDFNGDGILDVVLGGSGISEAGNGGSSSLLLGRGDGTFTHKGLLSPPTDSLPLATSTEMASSTSPSPRPNTTPSPSFSVTATEPSPQLRVHP